MRTWPFRLVSVLHWMWKNSAPSAVSPPGSAADVVVGLAANAACPGRMAAGNAAPETKSPAMISDLVRVMSVSSFRAPPERRSVHRCDGVGMVVRQWPEDFRKNLERGT